MSSRGNEVAKFFCGVEAWHAFVHAVLWLSGTELTVFGLEMTTTWSLLGFLLNAAVSVGLGYYGWAPRVTVDRPDVPSGPELRA